MKILLNEQQIAERIVQLGAEITHFYQGKPLTVVPVLTGSLPFAADLIRKIELPLWIDPVAVSSYENDATSGHVSLRLDTKLPVQERHLLFIDDILDSGLTLNCLMQTFQKRGALSTKSCILMDKQRKRNTLIKADWTGFTIPDEYIIGYGLDSNQEYRNLPYIAVKDH